MNNNLYIPPHDLQAERGVLGSLMMIAKYDSSSFQKTIETVKDGAFYSRAHKIIYQGIKQVSERDGYVDLLTLTNKIEKDGNIDAVGGLIYVAELIRYTQSAENINNYARLVRE